MSQGVIHEHCANDIRLHVLSVLQSALPNRPRSATALAVACGGNAETLAALASGPRTGGLGTLNPRLLRDRLWQILQLDVEGRMKNIWRAPRSRGGHGRCGHRSGDGRAVVAASAHDHAARGRARRLAP